MPKIVQESNGTVHKLNAISIPYVRFENADLIDVVDFLFCCIGVGASSISSPTLYKGESTCTFVIPLVDPYCLGAKNVILQASRPTGEKLTKNYTPFSNFGKLSCALGTTTLHNAYLKVAELCNGQVKFYNDLVLLSVPVPNNKVFENNTE